MWLCCFSSRLWMLTASKRRVETPTTCRTNSVTVIWEQLECRYSWFHYKWWWTQFSKAGFQWCWNVKNKNHTHKGELHRGNVSIHQFRVVLLLNLYTFGVIFWKSLAYIMHMVSQVNPHSRLSKVMAHQSRMSFWHSHLPYTQVCKKRRGMKVTVYWKYYSPNPTLQWIKL